MSIPPPLLVRLVAHELVDEPLVHAPAGTQADERVPEDVQAPEVWVTHGREEALIHAAGAKGICARALSLVGREEEGQ